MNWFLTRLQRYSVWIFVALLLLAITAAANIGEALTPTHVGGKPGWFLPTILIRLLKGTMVWAPSAWIVLAVFVGVLLAGMVAITMYSPSGGAKPKELAQRLGTGDDLAPLKEKAATKDARQLHPQAPWLPPGQVIGRAVTDNAVLYQGWRSTGLAIIAPGGGKTSGMVVPRMAAAPGPAFMTGNKVDGVWQVIAARQDLGKIWMMDEGEIYRQEPTPDFIINFARLLGTFTDKQKTVIAEELAKSFVIASQKNSPGVSEQQMKEDAQFGPSGTKAMAWFLLATIVNNDPVWKIHEWAFKGELERVASLLDEGGFEAQAIEIRGFDKWPDKTRGSLLATLQRMCGDLGHRGFRDWTTPSSFIREFDPDKFLDSKDTLIMLSERRPGGTGAVIAAVLKFIIEAAKRQTPGESRLRVPLVGELDEVANIAPLASLPEDYSHFGSRGLCITAYYQAWGQIVAEYGITRAKVLWQTAGVRVIGANEEDDFTQGLSRVVGTYQKNLGDKFGTRDVAKAGVDDFADLPELHAIIFTSKTKPAVIKLQRWFENKPLKRKIENGKEALKQVHRAAAPAPESEKEAV